MTQTLARLMDHLPYDLAKEAELYITPINLDHDELIESGYYELCMGIKFSLYYASVACWTDMEHMLELVLDNLDWPLENYIRRQYINPSFLFEIACKRNYVPCMLILHKHGIECRCGKSTLDHLPEEMRPLLRLIL